DSGEGLKTLVDGGEPEARDGVTPEAARAHRERKLTPGMEGDLLAAVEQEVISTVRHLLARREVVALPGHRLRALNGGLEPRLGSGSGEARRREHRENEYTEGNGRRPPALRPSSRHDFLVDSGVHDPRPLSKPMRPYDRRR